MSGYLWPRMGEAAAAERALALGECSLTERRDAAAVSHPAAAPAPTGGPSAPPALIAEVQGELRALADQHGWPQPLPADDRRAFDRSGERLLHDRMRIVPADAASDEVWAFLAWVVAPDVARWRFPAGEVERLSTAAHHVFGRLWWRQQRLGDRVLDHGTPPPTEDELELLFLRPLVVADDRLARALLTAVVGSGVEGRQRAIVLRRSAASVHRLMPARCFDVLGDDELARALDEVVATAGSPATPQPSG